MHRKILHIDMDAFFASIEQRDNPRYRGKPLVVGGRPEQRGAVAAASYEARRYGIHSAMPSRIAIQRCPHVIFEPPRFEAYRAASQQIRDIFTDFTDLVEPLSLDEAYLDVTTNHLATPSAMTIARQIKQKIYDKTHLTASAGVSINKFLAKIASDLDKPNGLTLIAPNQADAFLHLPINHNTHTPKSLNSYQSPVFSLKTNSTTSILHHTFCNTNTPKFQPFSTSWCYEAFQNLM